MLLETNPAVRCTRNTAAALESSTITLAYLCIVLFIAAAAAIGGGLVCIGFFGFSAPLLSLDAGATCCVRVASEGRWPANNHSGGSRPLLADHAELAALEQRQPEAARARRGWRPISRALSSRFDKRTHRRLPADIAPAHDGCPPVSFLLIFEKISAEASVNCWPSLAAAQFLCPPTAAGLHLLSSEQRTQTRTMQSRFLGPGRGARRDTGHLQSRCRRSACSTLPVAASKSGWQ